MAFKPLKVSENIYWVGAVDWCERDFHNFNIVRGTSYNAYLIIDDKITLVDTVKHEFFHEMIERIKKLIDPSKIDYIVSNHAEIDHSGSLPLSMEVAKNATVICTSKGREGLCRYFDCKDWNFKVVKTGDELKIGGRTLTFIEMPMLHWPDSMATYIKEDKLLFSSDAFGQHIASIERHDEELGVEEAVEWAKAYYANILMPFSELIKMKINEIEKLGIQVRMIAPAHGVVWKNPSKIISAYKDWAEFRSENKLVVIYDTMWSSTEALAKAIVDGAKHGNVKVRLFHVRKDSWSEIVTEILDAKAIAIGAPTMHNTVFPPVAGFLAYMKSLKPKNKIGVAFSSYGWGGGAVREINKVFEELKFEIMEPLQVRYKPTSDDLEKAFELGVKIAEKIGK
ncbi:MAG: FprA family A-type flavoprotein [Candidatus Bathyarchaeota archaeon]